MISLVVACFGWLVAGLAMGLKHWGFWQYANLFCAIVNTVRAAFVFEAQFRDKRKR